MLKTSKFYSNIRKVLVKFKNLKTPYITSGVYSTYNFSGMLKRMPELLNRVLCDHGRFLLNDTTYHLHSFCVLQCVPPS